MTPEGREKKRFAEQHVQRETKIFLIVPFADNMIQ
jgi:hypothetical protein